MEVGVPEAYARVDWVVPGRVALYELLFQDGLKLPIPNLASEVLDHFEIAPSQLVSNVWRLLMSLECLSMRHVVKCKLGEVLYSYYLKEHDKENMQYQFILRKDRSALVTCLRSND